LHTGRTSRRVDSFALQPLNHNLLMLRAYIFYLTVIHDDESGPHRHDHDSISATTSSPQCDPGLLAFDGGQYGRLLQHLFDQARRHDREPEEDATTRTSETCARGVNNRAYLRRSWLVVARSAVRFCFSMWSLPPSLGSPLQAAHQPSSQDRERGTGRRARR
jgi:hypothetical protein